jgi:hypothetical protein
MRIETIMHRHGRLHRVVPQLGHVVRTRRQLTVEITVAGRDRPELAFLELISKRFRRALNPL